MVNATPPVASATARVSVTPTPDANDLLSSADIIDLQAKAKGHHRRRAVGMVADGIIFAILFASLAPLVQFIQAHQIGLRQIPSLFAEITLYEGLLCAPVIVLLSFVVTLGSRLWVFRYNWPIHVQKSANVNTKELIEGFTEVFRTYAKSKREATNGFFSVGYGVFACAIYAYHYVVDPSAYVTALFFSSLVLTLLIWFQSYELAETFLPGEIFINQLMEMNERVQTSQETIEVVRARLQHDQANYKRRKYWWFY